MRHLLAKPERLSSDCAGSITIDLAKQVAPGRVLCFRMPCLTTCVRSADRDGYLLAPGEPLREQLIAWTEQLKADQGIRVRLAKHLRALLRTAGFVRVEASASYDGYGAPESVRLFGNTMAALAREGWYADLIIEFGWADRVELEAIALTWQRWGESPDAFMAMAFCEAVGWC